jgi:taurine dioxygenase
VLPALPQIMLIDTHPGFLPDNDNWHTDVTFSQTPPMAGILAAKRLPGTGGDTLWSSSSAAYAALSVPLQEMLDGLTATHSVAKSFPAERWAGDPAFKERYERAVAKHPPVTHPVVRTHPVTGRKALYVNKGFTKRIIGVPLDESEAVLGYLYEHMANPLFQCRFRWRENSIAFWDNRCVQHHAMWDYWPHTRSGHRVTVKGDRPV